MLANMDVHYVKIFFKVATEIVGKTNKEVDGQYHEGGMLKKYKAMKKIEERKSSFIRRRRKGEVISHTYRLTT